MENIITSLISQIKNPWQYICIGFVWCSILYLNIEEKYTIPAILITIGIAAFIKKIVNYVLDFIGDKQIEKEILFNLMHMNNMERSFVYHCFSNNIQTASFEILSRGGTIWNTLPQKRIAVKPSGIQTMEALSLTIPSYVWKIIEKHQKEIFTEEIADEN